MLTSTAKLLNQPVITELTNLEYEKCRVLGVVNDTLVYLPECDITGDSGLVCLPAIKSIEDCCHKLNTNKVLLVHNHPYVAGKADPNPSAIDIASTKLYYKWLKMGDVDLIDHIIVSPVGYFSFKDSGKVIGVLKVPLANRIKNSLNNCFGNLLFRKGSRNLRAINDNK